MTASYPNSVKSFTTKTDGVDDVMASHVNDIQDEVTAIENDLTTGTYGNYDAFQTRMAGLKSVDATDGVIFVTGSNVRMNMWTGSHTYMGIVTGTFVGIGTTTPGSKLVVHGGSLQLTGIRVAPTSGTGLEMGYNGSTIDILGYNRSTGGYQTINMNDNLTIVGGAGANVYSVAWTDYSATSTIVGWTSFTSKVIYYKKIGKLVFVMMNIQGTSDNTATTFTLPYTAATTMYNAIYSMNNGTEGIGYVGATASSATITCYYGPGFGTWTASGNKRVVGQFFYEAA